MGSRWLDVCGPDDRPFRVPNTTAGAAEILDKCEEGVVLVLEATGVYYRGLAFAAVERGISVRVVNPWQVKAFATSRLSRVKTDRTDARLIRDFGERMLPDLRRWWPSPPGLDRVQLVVRLADGLMRHRVAAGNRAHAADWTSAEVVELARELEGTLETERERLMARALELAHDDELVGEWLRRVATLPGFGEISGLRFLAYAGDLRRFPNARAFAAYTGLAPRLDQSGTSDGVGRISRVGSRPLRGVLYWSAISATRSNSPQGEYYRRLIEAGKPKKVALCALANKLARAGWAVCVSD